MPTRAGVRMALEQDGLTVCAEAANATEAVDAALRERPDVCLLDVHMPGSGTAAASMISSHLPSTVVLMLTVSHQGEDLFESLRQGRQGIPAEGDGPVEAARRRAGCAPG